MTEASFRIFLHAVTTIFTLVLMVLRRNYGSAKTSETLVQALEDVDKRRLAKAERKANRLSTRGKRKPPLVD